MIPAQHLKSSDIPAMGRRHHAPAVHEEYQLPGCTSPGTSNQGPEPPEVLARLGSQPGSYPRESPFQAHKLGPEVGRQDDRSVQEDAG